MIRCRRLLALVVVVACAAAPAAQNPPAGGRGGRALPGGRGGDQRPGMPPRDAVDRVMPRGTGTLRGRVVADNGLPIRRAQVRAIRMGAGRVGNAMPGADGLRQIQVTPSVVTATTDGDGRWQMLNLPAGEFTISVVKAGYVNVSYGQKGPQDPGERLSLADGQTLGAIDVIMPRGGVVAGRISDEFGEPLANAQVQVQRYQYGPGGEKQLMSAPSGVQGPIMTDDLGQFRVFGLMPGDYVVSAGVRSFNGSANIDDSDRDGYPPTFYPGTPNVAEATTVMLGAGEEASVQFSLQPARLSRISGRVVDSLGRPAANTVIMLSSGSGATVGVNGAGRVRGDGTFVLNAVPPGEHTLIVRPQPRNMGDEPEFASVRLSVGGDDISDLVITTSRGVTLRGRLTFEGAAQRPANPVRVVAQPTDGPRAGFNVAGNDQVNGVVGADGTFQLRAGFGNVLFRAAAPGWILKSVTLDGRDVTDTPVDVSAGAGTVRIVLTDRATTLSGIVESRNQPGSAAYVVIQPEADMVAVAAQRYSRVTRPDENGRYSVNGLPPGRYVAAAVDSLSQGSEWSPAFRQMLLGSGDGFTLTEGQTLALNLRLRPSP